jgi:hypothetical protein
MSVAWKILRYPKQLLDYWPIGGGGGRRRRPGRYLKRILHGYSREAETGHLLTWLPEKKTKKKKKICYCWFIPIVVNLLQTRTPYNKTNHITAIALPFVSLTWDIWTEHHAIKAYWGSGGIASFILDEIYEYNFQIPTFCTMSFYWEFDLNFR